MKPWRYMKRWLSPPVFEDEQKSYAAKMLYTTLGFAVLGQLLMAVRVLARPETAARTMGFGAAVLLMIAGLLALTRAGRVRPASWLAVVLFWLFIQAVFITGGGLAPSPLLGVVSLTIFTGLLFGIRGGVVMAGVNLADVMILAWGETQGWFPAPTTVNPPFSLAIEAAFHIAQVAVLLTVARRSVDNALKRVRQELEERKRAEAALRQSEANYREIFNSTSDAMFVHDVSGRILDVNQRVCDLYRCSREEGLKATLDDFSAGISPYGGAEALEKIRRALEEGTQVFEWRSRRRDGTLFWTEVALRASDIAGEKRVIASVRDITERKQAGEALRQSEETLRRILDVSPMPIAWADAGGRIEFWNRKAVELFGYSGDEVATVDQWYQRAYPDAGYRGEVVDRWNRIVAEAKQKGTEIQGGEVRVTCKDGSVRLVEVVGTFVGDRLLVIFRDVTEQKRALEALRESEASLTVAQSLARVGSWEIDPVTGRGPWSQEMFHLFGLDPASGAPTLDAFMSLVHPEDREPLLAIHRQVLASGERRQADYRTDPARGPVRHFTTVIEAVKEPSGRVARLVGAVQDVTERKQAEEALAESEERYRTLVNNMKDVLYSLSADGKITFISDQIKAYGYSAAEMLGRDFSVFIHADDLPAVMDDFQHTLTTGEETQSVFRLIPRDGKVHWFEESGRPIRDKAGRVVAVNGILRDITDRKGSEDRIREQAALLHETHDAILVWDLERGVQFMNPAAEEMIGTRLGDALGKDLPQVLMTPSDLVLRAALQEVKSLGAWNGELVVQAGSSRERALDSRWTTLLDEEGNPRSVLITCNDITEKKRLEAQYLRAQRLESVGTLASGVAHDLNNILSPVIMGVEMLKATAEDAETQGILATIQESAQRGSDTVRQLLMFARGTEFQKGPIQPRHLLKELERLLQQSFPKNIRIHTEFAQQPLTVLADPSQLHQVLLNLSVNARDAMPEGGVLFISLENRTLDASSANLHPKARPIPYVVFKVSDSGNGIPPEILDRVFDPFFTTKPQGKGTGLGLATVLGIVEGHGGFVLVDSKPGKGTTFQVFIPASASAEHAGEAREVPPLPRGQGELVLVVDDESAILHVADNFLKRNGYATLTASSASQALDLFGKYRADIRVVLTDIMMPFGDGRQLISTLREMDGRLPVIAMSGLATAEARQDVIGKGASAFIDKPFNAGQLLTVLHEMLARTGQSG